MGAVITIRQAHEAFHVSKEAIRKACQRGRIPGATRKGRVWMFEVADFRWWLHYGRRMGRPVTTGAGLRRRRRKE